MAASPGNLPFKSKGDLISHEDWNDLVRQINASRKWVVTPSAVATINVAEANMGLDLSQLLEGIGDTPLVISGVLNGTIAHATVYSKGPPEEIT